MRHRTRIIAPTLLAFVLITLGSYALVYPAAAQVVFTYAPGWNIVAGPTGSIFTGATMLYAFPAEASDYTALSGTSAAQIGQGYWAYFPTCGQSPLADNPPSCQVTLAAEPGGWFLAGNPSSTGVAHVTGVTEMLTYTSASGYFSVSALAPGFGAWILPDASGLVTIDGVDCWHASARASGNTVVTPTVASSPPVPAAAPAVAATPTASSSNYPYSTPRVSPLGVPCWDGTLDYSGGAYPCYGRGGVVPYASAATAPVFGFLPSTQIYPWPANPVGVGPPSALPSAGTAPHVPAFGSSGTVTCTPNLTFPGNGGGPTMCANGGCSNSAGSGTCSGHGGEADVPETGAAPPTPEE